MPPAQQPRQQHLVPRSYLERFTDERGRLLVVSRSDTTRRREARPKEVATQRDFYTQQLPDGTSDYSLESRLSTIETAAIEAIREVCDEGAPLTDHRKDAICGLIAYQRVRGVRSRRMGEAIATVLERVMSSAWLDDNGDLVEGMTRLPDGELAPPPSEHQRVLVSAAEGMHSQLSGSDALVLSVGGPMLLTSDEPVACWVAPQNYNPLQGIGPLTADQLWFPLDPSHVLVIANTRASRDFLARLHPVLAAIQVNRMVAAQAYEEIYMRPGRELIKALDLPPPMSLTAEIHGVSGVDGVGGPPLRRRPRRR